MKIRMSVSIEGADISAKPGDEIDIEEGWAKRLVESGQAEYVKTKAAKTTRTVKAKETR